MADCSPLDEVRGRMKARRTGTQFGPQQDKVDLEILLDEIDGPVEAADFQLPPRLQGVMESVAAGQTNAQIAAAFYLSPKTVKNYVSQILMLAGVENRTQAAVMWLRHH